MDRSTMNSNYAQDDENSTENNHGDSSRSATRDTNSEQTDSQSEHDIGELRDAAANKLYDIEAAADGPHEGIELEHIIGFLRNEYGVSRDRAEEAIHTALMEGYCYEPGVSEETDDRLLKPITRPITSNESDQPADSGEASGTTSQELASEEEKDAPGDDTTTIDLDQIQSFFQGNTSDTKTVKSIIESIESGLLTDSEIALAELESAIRDSQWDDELRELVLSAIETLLEERETQKEFARKVENGDIETDPKFPTPSEWEKREGAKSSPEPPFDPDAEQEPEWDDTDPILEEYHDHRQPEFPGQMSGESIHLQDDEWHEPRSLY